jgi:hypothetical protein
VPESLQVGLGWRLRFLGGEFFLCLFGLWRRVRAESHLEFLVSRTSSDLSFPSSGGIIRHFLEFESQFRWRGCRGILGVASFGERFFQHLVKFHPLLFLVSVTVPNPIRGFRLLYSLSPLGLFVPI